MRKLVAAVVLVLAVPAAASAGGTITEPQISSNWAGYAAVGTLGAPAEFKDVTGTWVVPKATCTVGRADAVAFWVGLGGFSDGSESLQQLGTESECSGRSTTPTYSVWWEIVPAASVPVKMKLLPGDAVTAAVLVDGRKVTMSLKNVTRKTRFSKTIVASHPLDLSSAEWIAEAPAQCTARGRCRVVNLTKFGTVTFTKAAAIGSAHAGTISDPAWDVTPLRLVTGGAAGRFFVGGDVLGPGVGAVPADLSADGRSFSISWQQGVTPAA
ncbi:MAG TPA: G1 family glutamic endopeptidase [Gaiellaceae bacterium]|nr:G1 family glutamic endopeptidase [Gaiellaceae bacterium]